MVFRNVIPGTTVLGRSFVFSQSCFQVSASLPSISGLAVSAIFNQIKSLQVLRFDDQSHHDKTDKTDKTDQIQTRGINTII